MTKAIVSGSPLNGPISAALLVKGKLVVGNTPDANGTSLLMEISSSAGVIASRNVDTGLYDDRNQQCHWHDNSNPVVALSN